MTFNLRSNCSNIFFDFSTFVGYIVILYQNKKYVSKITNPILVVMDKNNHYYYHLHNNQAIPLNKDELSHIRKEYYQFPPLFIKAQLLEHFTVIDTTDKEVSVANVDYTMAQLFLKNVINPMITTKYPDMNVQLLLDKDVRQKQALFHLPNQYLYLVLCLYRKKECISSITYSFYDDHSIMIESKTILKEENKKYNTLLRAITVLISDKLIVNNDAIRIIKSQPINWISAWLLVNKFGFIKDESGIIQQKQEFKKKFNEEDDYELHIEAQSYKKAWNVFLNTLEKMN